MSLLLLLSPTGATASDPFVGEVGLVMQSTTFTIVNVVSAHEIGLMAAHSVTVAGHSAPWAGECAVHMVSSTRKFVPTSMVPGSMTMLGVGL